MKPKTLFLSLSLICALTSLACAQTVKTDHKIYVNYSSDGSYPSEGTAWVDGNYPTAPVYSDGSGQTFTFYTWYYYWGGWGYGPTDQAWAGVDISAVSGSADDHEVTLNLVPCYKGDCDSTEVYGSAIAIPKANYTVAYVSVSGSQSLNWIWYFDGSTPTNYAVKNEVAITVMPDGISFTDVTWWSEGPITATKQFWDSKKANIASTGKSASPDDAKATAGGYVGGATNGSWVTAFGTCTVDYLKDAVITNGPNTYSNAWTIWETRTTFACNSKFGSTMTAALEHNENWVSGSYQLLYSGGDWNQPPAGSNTAAANNWVDHIAPPTSALKPKPTFSTSNPIDADTWNGSWRAGSQTAGNGTTAMSLTWTRRNCNAHY